MTDNFYSQFEQSFRGKRAEIKGRLEVYSPFVAPLVALYPGALALDLGCGRGEWLESLREKGFTVMGVDLDDGMLADCKALGLDVKTQDAIAALNALDDASVSIVSAFHLVEHIPFDTLRTLVSEALRILKPGGLLIMETPNPENVMVGTSSFYLDPTHTRPIPPGLLSFIPKYYGFQSTMVLRLQESPELRQGLSPSLLDVLAGASPDYAVIAQKSANKEVLERFSSAFALDLGLTIETLASRYDQAIRWEVAEAAHKLAESISKVAESTRKVAESSDQALVALEARVDQHINANELSISALDAQTQERFDANDRALLELNTQLNARAESLDASITALNTQINAVYSSSSWKVTRPLRALGTGLRRIKQIFIRRK